MPPTRQLSRVEHPGILIDTYRDPTANAKHRQTACQILQDDDIWQHAYEHVQMWRCKGNSRLQTQMRKD